MKVIEVKNISKTYAIGSAAKDSIIDSVRGLFKSKTQPKSTFNALTDISFEVNQGEVLGIVGKNGAGKSTLLKVLSRITEPTNGEITMRGRVASLLEVGTGFHPELSGRENIFLNGSILGMTRAEIKSKFDEIVAFSGVEKFIDTPVKHYSSGMYVRLAFSVAAHLEPEILIIDEVLAVGDAEFQKKCLGKMKDVAGQGRTVLFVSHNMAAVKSLCSRVLVIDQGALLYNGSSQDAVDFYFKNSSGTITSTHKKFSPSRNDEALVAVVEEFRVYSNGKGLNDLIIRNDEIVFEVSILKKVKEFISITLRFKDESGNYLFVTSKLFEDDSDLAGNIVYKLVIPKNFFNEGLFYVDLIINHKQKQIFCENDIISFNVLGEPKVIGSWMGKTKGALKPDFNWKFSYES